MSEIKPELWLVELGQGMGPLHLGDTPHEVLRKLVEAGIEYEAEEDDEGPISYVDELDAELKFKTSQPPTLLEIECWDDRVKIGPLEVIDERLHTFLERLHVQDNETVWRLERINQQESPDGPLLIATDKELFKRGTLWIPHLGLGLVMLSGDIGAVCIRKPEEAPKHGQGSLTPEQRELSARDDVYSHIVGPRLILQQPPQNRWVQALLNLGLAAAVGFTAWRAFDYQRQWSDAVVVQGDVVEVRPPPPDPFPDEFDVSYQDQAGQPHRVTLKQSDVYGTPRVGETVELRYLASAADKPMGPVPYRDATFEKFLPIGIGIFVVYMVLQIALPLGSVIFQIIAQRAKAREAAEAK